MVASADAMFRGRVQVRTKGLLGRMTWTTRTCEVEDDVLRVFDKRGKVVVGVPLPTATTLTSKSGATESARHRGASLIRWLEVERFR